MKGAIKGILIWQKIKKQKKQTKKKNQKVQKHKNTKKRAFQLSVKISFLGGIPKIALFDNLAQKARTPKHYKNRGFSTPIFEKQLCVTKRPFLDQKNPNS